MSHKIVVVVVLMGILFCNYGKLNAQDVEPVVADSASEAVVSSAENELWGMMLMVFPALTTGQDGV